MVMPKATMEQEWLAHEVTVSGIETWRPIPGFTWYEASDLGRLRSFAPYRGSSVPRVLSPSVSSNGYLDLLLRDSDGSQKHRLVHRLVLSAFVPCPGPRYQVDHLNEDRLDNRLVNLEWVTCQENHLRRTMRRGQMRTFECPCCCSRLFFSQSKQVLEVDTRTGVA